MIVFSHTAEPQASLQVSCRELTPQDTEVREILADDADYTEVLPPREESTTGEDEGGDDGDEVTKPTLSNDTKFEGKGMLEQLINI